MEDQEKRSEHRARALKSAKIVLNDRHSTIDCVVRDLSKGGAKLKVTNPVAVPESFELLLESDNVMLKAEVIWRKGDQVGVQFIREQAD
ncbi:MULTISPECIES: PilZ domain-containing protein [Afifella]|uniref:PilZ domain-containing protein n=1 Tax=Afifella TaxID=643217 RepID=UPI000FE2A500|nr:MULTISPECIES: PilZ domain-containing protein [Afifella]MCF1503391.1 PilZ domain-containing protein [Afifella sp. H1R]MCT8267432.1 PilZ domain-containing protein [Afifella sp. JA880]